jgi:hypothetical protein
MKHMLTVLLRKSYPDGANRTYSETFDESEYESEKDSSFFMPIGPMEIKVAEQLKGHFILGWLECFAQSDTHIEWVYDGGVTVETKRKERKE